jgi:hypothetical protein
MIQLNNYSQLREFLEQNKLTQSEIEEIVMHSLNLFIVDKFSTKDLLLKLDEYYINYIQNNYNSEKPLFLMATD